VGPARRWFSVWVYWLVVKPGREAGFELARIEATSNTTHWLEGEKHEL